MNFGSATNATWAWNRTACVPIALALAALTVPLANSVRAQQDSLQAINADYLRELGQVEKKRLDRLEKLAGAAEGASGVELYVTFFQTALNGGLYREAEPVAERLLKQQNLDHRVLFLAEITNILAELDRGEYEGALKSLSEAVKTAREADANNQPVAMVLPRHTRLAILQTYYQKLVQADQFEVARKAFELLVANITDATLLDYAKDRLARLAMIGKPAPAIVGKDIDGKPFRLADEKGQVVLVVFWASWCLPCGPEAEMLDQVLTSYKAKGLRIVGIDVDNLQADAESAEEIAGDVRRFVVEHNLHFTNLINGAGDQDFAKAYGVRDIPANFLIDREGRVGHVDLTLSNIDAVVQKALGK